MYKPPCAQDREKIFAAESTPLPWAPPITHVKPLLGVLKVSIDVNFHLPSFIALENNGIEQEGERSEVLR
jgi:hypothetical protein